MNKIFLSLLVGSSLLLASSEAVLDMEQKLTINYDKNSTGFIKSNFPVSVRSDGSNDMYPSTGLVPVNHDEDAIVDYLDNDSDNDLLSDCLEGLPDNGSKLCPVDNISAGNTVGINGLVEWAEISTGDNYAIPNGLITDPVSYLQDEILNGDRRAYRESGCGTAQVDLTAFQWKTISFSCNTGSNSIETLLGGALGSYGDNADWVMYKQPDGDYSGATVMMAASETVVPGKGYWIITNANKTAKVAKSLSDISSTSTDWVLGLNYPGIPVFGQSFRKVTSYTLPASISSDTQKILVGNPFYKAYNLSDVYYKNGTNDYVSTTTLTAGSSPMEPIVYVKDSSDTSTGNYVAIDPGSTPGFGARVPVMQGYWIKLNASPPAINKITFPYEK